MPQTVLIHVWIEADDGPQFLCGMHADDVVAAVAERRIHEFPMDMVCSDCLRAFAGRRLNVCFHIGGESDDEALAALCGEQTPEYVVRGKYADGLNAQDWCPECKAAWEKRSAPSQAQ